MTKRERIFRLLEGKPIDRAPTGFWLHFPEEMHRGEKAVEAHLEFMSQTDTDILKVMNENLMHDGISHVRSTRDIASIRAYSRSDKLITEQTDTIKAVCERVGGQYPVVATLHGLVASAFHSTGFQGYYASMGYGLAVFCREKPREMKDALRRVTDSLLTLVDCSLEAGADGIFYAALGGEKHFFTDEEFAEFIAPLEAEIYGYIKQKTKLDILHICKSNIDFSRYTSLDPSVINWSVWQNGLSLSEGAKIFPDSVILGGFQDRSGVLVDGTQEEIADQTRAILNEMEGKRIIVGADCTLPTDISCERVRTVVRTLEEMSEANASLSDNISGKQLRFHKEYICL